MAKKIESPHQEKNARIWYRSRNEAGISQEKLAMELGVAKRTIQNWEKGVTSPTVDQAIRYFKILNIQPLPYILEYLYPTLENIKATDEDEKIREAMIELMKALPAVEVRELFYLLYGNHGSSPTGILQMVTAHLQSPMRDRLSHGSMILQDYEIAKVKGELTNEKHIQPDTILLRNAIEKGQDAVTKNKNAYILDEKKVIE